MEKPHRPNRWHEDARRLTDELRTSDRREWVAVRDFLEDRGIAPDESAIGEWGPEQAGYVGVLVTPDRTAFMLDVESWPWTQIQVTLTELIDPDLKFIWGQGAFGAMALLEAERPTGARPIGFLVEYLRRLNREFRGYLVGASSLPWAADGFWVILADHLSDRSIDPSTMVTLHWVSGNEIDGGLLDAQGRCFHFTGSLAAWRGPITEITTWDELGPSEARSIYGELVDAGLELLQQAS